MNSEEQYRHSVEALADNDIIVKLKTHYNFTNYIFISKWFQYKFCHHPGLIKL